MKSTCYSINFLALALICMFCSCQSDTPASDPNKAKPYVDEGPITHNLDTAVGYCFQMAENGIQEVVEVKISGNIIKGEGYRVYVGLQLTYQLFIEGLIKGDKAEVSIRATEARKGKETFIHTETWVLAEEQLEVKARDVEGLKGDFKYFRTTCGRQKNKDTTRYDYFAGFNEGYAVVAKNGKYGLVNEKWEVTVPLQFRDLGIVNEGSIVFYDEYTGMRGILDVEGRVLVEPQYTEIHCFNEGLAAFLNENGKWGFMNKDLKVVIEPKYKNINFFKPDPSRHPFNEGLANVQFGNDRWNYINTDDEVVIAGNFLHAEAFKNGKARVFRDNKWFFINRTGKCIEDCDE